MSSQLYNSQLMKHYREPNGWSQTASLPNQFMIENTHCGDELYIGIRVNRDRLTELEFTGECCAVCRASASILHSTLIELPVQQIKTQIAEVKNWLCGSGEMPNFLSPLSMLEQNYVRRQCAELPWSGVEQMLAVEN